MRSLQEQVDKERERRLLKEKGGYCKCIYPRDGWLLAHEIKPANL